MADRLLLSGDMQDTGSDGLLLDGDEQSGSDVVLLTGVTSGTSFGLSVLNNPLRDPIQNVLKDVFN